MLTQERHPALDFRLRDVAQKSEMAYAQQIVLEKTQGHLVPFQGFWASMVGRIPDSRRRCNGVFAGS